MKFSGVTILQGVEFSIFPIDFEWALQQCSATALPVMNTEREYVASGVINAFKIREFLKYVKCVKFCQMLITYF